jgi:hypothetical protein
MFPCEWYVSNELSYASDLVVSPKLIIRGFPHVNIRTTIHIVAGNRLLSFNSLC